MKPTINKDNNYSLHNISNYQKELNSCVSEIMNKYFHIIIEYFKFIMENLKIKKLSYSRFIIIRGLDTISHVFLNLLYYTKNVDLTYFHCQKSFCFYVEFVGQITEDDKMFLQLSSRDATTYVYKKTVFDINNECKKINKECSEDTMKNFEVINIYINIYKTVAYKILKSEILNIDNIFLEYFEKFHNKLCKYSFNKEDLIKIDSLIEKIYHKINNIVFFLETVIILLKKIYKNINIIKICERNIIMGFSEENLSDTPDKFVMWLTS